MKVLVVDDDRILVKGLLYVLSREGFETDFAYDGREAMQKIKSGVYDIVLLDNMLPIHSGYEVCKMTREFSNIPIIMVTAKAEDEDKLIGFSSGADDYITKPFNVKEVVARLNAVARRSSADQKKVLPVALDEDIKDALINGERAGLTVKEFELLELLIKNPGKAYSRADLFSKIWRTSGADPRTVDVHIRRIREKIEEDPANPKFILTKWGVGYYFGTL